ncbi:MAG: hypothetical protein IJJ13_08395 [Lachnospiraceae bacterium]|nr:hypothetical protein [Lachnospiraceae bacterium]
MAKRRIQFTEKTQSKRAMIALLLSGGSLAGLILCVGISAKNEGTSSAYIGSAGIFLFLLSLAGLVVSIVSLREENSFPVLPRVSCFLSVLVCAAWVGLYGWGLSH